MVSSNRNAYCDFCVSDKMGWNKISKLSKLGYKTIALNKTIDDTAFETKKKNKKNETREILDIVPAPTLVPKDNDTQIKILHRLTVQISEVNSCLKVSQSENVKKYDILAVIPTTSAALSHACTTMDVDIISFSPEARSVLKINRKLYKQAVERGVFFEIMYAPALKDSTCRKNIIQRAHLYHAIGKSANIIISSGAETEFQIRGPYDIINLGLILGMNEQLCKNSMSENARKVLLKADNRKRGKAAVFISTENKIVKENEDLDFSLSQCKRMKIET